MKSKFQLAVLLTLFGLFFGAFTVNAEESSSIIMNLVPATPAPGQTVSVSISSFSEDLNAANISWFANGKNISSGVGKKNVTVVTPASGSELTILAVVNVAGAQSEVKTVIRPAEMVLLWQASDSYVPPFYKGKALPAPDTIVKVVAIPEIRSAGGGWVDNSSMVYSWQKEYENEADASGYSRNYFKFRNDYLENFNVVGVNAYTGDQKYFSSGSIKIKMYSPELDFYRRDEKLGIIWEKSLSSPHIITGSDVIVASPYFISPKDIRNPFLKFNWFLNDAPIYVGNYKKTTMPLAIQSGTSGKSELRLEIESDDKIFQTAKKSLDIEF